MGASFLWCKSGFDDAVEGKRNVLGAKENLDMFVRFYRIKWVGREAGKGRKGAPFGRGRDGGRPEWFVLSSCR
jgi:hypothetical protein